MATSRPHYSTAYGPAQANLTYLIYDVIIHAEGRWWRRDAHLEYEYDDAQWHDLSVPPKSITLTVAGHYVGKYRRGFQMLGRLHPEVRHVFLEDRIA